MFYLIATILLNVLLSAAFKLFPKFRINTLQAIVVNYWVCVVTGCIFIGHVPVGNNIITADWLPLAILMGIGFISIFNLIAFCTRADGITTTTIANKLSLVIPVLFSIFVYHESAGIYKIAGILLAFPAVYLTAHVKGDTHKARNILLPVLLFIGSGILDTLMNFIQSNFLHTADVQSVFAVYCFGVAGIIGSIIVAILLLRGKMEFDVRNIIAGICLGVPNYFSIYYFIRLLNSRFLQSSASIPVCNIGILVASSLTAIFLFKERPSTLRILGLVMAIAAILLIAFGDK